MKNIYFSHYKIKGGSLVKIAVDPMILKHQLGMFLDVANVLPVVEQSDEKHLLFPL